MGKFELPVNIEKSTDRQKGELDLKFGELSELADLSPKKEVAASFSRLGRDYEKIRDIGTAKDCYLKSAEILEVLGEYDEAAMMFERAGDEKKADIIRASIVD